MTGPKQQSIGEPKKLVKRTGRVEEPFCKLNPKPDSAAGQGPLSLALHSEQAEKKKRNSSLAPPVHVRQRPAVTHSHRHLPQSLPAPTASVLSSPVEFAAAIADTKQSAKWQEYLEETCNTYSAGDLHPPQKDQGQLPSSPKFLTTID